MAIASAEGSAREVPSLRRCLPGRLVRSYLARARNAADAAFRTRRVLALVGEQVLGLTQQQIARAFGVSESAICRDLEAVLDDLRAIGAAENISADSLFQRHERHTDGAGI